MKTINLRLNPTLSAALLISASAVSCVAQEQVTVPNAGFEEGLQKWNPSNEDAAAKLSQISTEAAHSGTNGLRVRQETVGVGSWLQSSKILVTGGKGYRLKFWARCVKQSGIGVWVNYFDAQGKNFATPPNLSVQIPQNVSDWKEYSLDLPVPEGAASFTAAIHSYSNQTCLADFDDFSVIPIDLSKVSAPPTPAPAAYKGPKLSPPEAARVKEIATYLDATPRGLGFTLDNRGPWEALAADESMKSSLIPRAERFLNEPIPVVDEAVYAESVKSGSRDINAAVDRRRFRLATFVLSEGVENKGRFLPAIEKELNAICSESSWIIAAHVKFTGKNDLGSAMTAWTLATTVSMLGDRLSEPTRKLVRDKVLERVVRPYLEQMRDANAAPDFWRYSAFNWNAVVHGGITGAALAFDDSVQERAEIVAAAEKETQLYIDGFPKDGYSTEGMGYWKYGFGHYIMMAEAVFSATKGKVNLYDKENIRQVAQFPRRFEIVPNVYPAYSDSQFKEEPATWLYHILDSRYALGDKSPRALSVGGMFSTFLYAWSINLAFDPGKVPPATKGAPIVAGHRLRDWFETSQIYVGRLPEKQSGLNVSFKGGNNGTSHGHNDLGTYVVVNGDVPLLVDAGSTVYNAATFGAGRYNIQVINSYGHSVPKVAGQLQSTGEKFYATVANTKLTDASDSITLDLTKGYEVPSLKSLLRTFDYSRAAKGAFTITDKVEFTSPQAFGTALITFGEAKEEKPGVWLVSQNGQSVRVSIDAGGAPFSVTNEVLKDKAAAGEVRRLGIDLNSPTAGATIKVTVTPAS